MGTEKTFKIYDVIYEEREHISNGKSVTGTEIREHHCRVYVNNSKEAVKCVKDAYNVPEDTKITPVLLGVITLFNESDLEILLKQGEEVISNANNLTRIASFEGPDKLNCLAIYNSEDE